MQQNPENNDSYMSEVLSSLSSKDRYFLAYYDPKGYYKADFTKMKPYFIVYREEKITTMKDLMDMFLDKHRQLTQLKKGMAWELYTGTKISPKWTLDQFKEGVRTEKIDGIRLFVYERKGEWSDEAAVTTYLTASDEHNQKPIQAPFFIEDVKFYIYLTLTPKSGIAETQKNLQKQIQRSLGVNVNPEIIQIFYKKSETIVPAQDKHLSNYFGLEKQKFIIRLKEKVALKLPPKQNNTFIIIRGEGLVKKMYDYDSIKDRKLINVLDQLIQLSPNKKLKKIALVFQGQLLRFNQTFSKFENICKNSTTTTKHFIGYLINEGLAFYYSYKQLVSQKLDYEKIFTKQQANLKKREHCDKQSYKVALAQKQPHFQNTENVSTILYYTSQLYVHGSDQKKETIYSNLNRFMREYDYCDAQILSKKDHWEYKFAAHLYNQLQQIKPLDKQTLWRGIKYNHQYSKGEKIHFQQFSSTSVAMGPALSFAETGLFMIVNSKSAHPIKKFSVFKSQNEALVEPYSTWEVKNIWKLKRRTIRSKSQKELLQLEENTYQQWRKKQIEETQINEKLDKKISFQQELQIDLIIFEELEKPKMPQMKSTVFLWVDDKTGEGKAIWQKIEQIKHTTVMIQLLSTAQLSNWLQKNSQMINDQDIEIVMITNMTRVQDGKKEEKAGVYAIDAFYKRRPKGTVFVYIGWVEGTINKLKAHNQKYIPNPNLRVSKQFKDMVDFLKEQGLKSK